MKCLARYLLPALLWCLVVAYIGYALRLVHRDRTARLVGELRIEVTDSTARGSLVKAAEVRRQIEQKGLFVAGAACDSVDLTAIEQLILRNGFVAGVEASVSQHGALSVRLSQRTPILRLRLEGMDGYVTREGYLFATPPRSARYVPVVTGSYRPPVPLDYTGLIGDYIDHRKWMIDTLITSLERSKYPYFAAERQNDKDLREVRRMRTSKRWWKLESEEAFEHRVEELRAQKAELRRKYRYRGRQIQASIDRISAEQERQRGEQKKLEKKYEDFLKLLTFVEYLEKEPFWRSEVVELIASTAPSGALEIDLVPRSGRFVVRFGRIEGVEEKLEKLLRFYRRGLAAEGWDRFSEVDIRFAGQVVCR